MEAEQIVAKIVRWGKRAPGKLKKWGNGTQNSKAKKDTDASLLVTQALSFGYLNGKRIARKK